MKRLTALLFLIIFSCLSGFSQKFEGGILGGLNGTQVDGDSYSGYKKPGIIAGAYVLTNLTQNIFAGLEFKFSQKGSRNIDSLAVDGQIKYIMRLNYAELPFYLGIKTNDRVTLLLGVSPGYLISGTEYNDYGKFVAEDQHPFNEFDLEALLGVRVKITNRLFIDVRGAYSLLPIREKPGTILSYWKGNQFNNVLSTTILYRLDF